MQTVAIIGGGFCGTLTAVNLARLSADPRRVVVVNDKYPLGRGVAYGTRRSEHLLNVVARNMSAFPDLPSHFVDWLRTRSDFADVPLAELREQFIPRRAYGDYLQDLLFWQSQPLGDTSRVRIELMEDTAIDLVPDGRGAQVTLKSGDSLYADQIVLATGNFAPHDLVPPGPVHEHPAYCANPWRVWYESLPSAREDVLLVGTGLTMIDVFLTLQNLGWEGKIYALSRNGLLPQPHFKGTDYPNFPPEDVDTLGLRGLVALIEDHCARLHSAGINPGVAVDKLRPLTQRIWRSFSVEEKQEFSRRYRTRWNVVRHRIPPVVARLIDTAQKEEKLHVLKGKLHEVRSDGDRIVAAIDLGHGRPARELTVGMLVNCTGPRESVNDAPDALFQNLSERGLVRADELDMGIDVTPDFAVVDREGQPSNFLFAIGPLLKGTLWETTAVPELRSQAYQVALALLAEDESSQSDWAEETPADLVEYYI